MIFVVSDVHQAKVMMATHWTRLQTDVTLRDPD